MAVKSLAATVVHSEARGDLSALVVWELIQEVMALTHGRGQEWVSTNEIIRAFR